MVIRSKPWELPETRIKSIIDEKTVEAANEKQKVRSSMYASDYGQCMRKVWYQFFPDEFPIEALEPRVLRIFANGNDVHERLASYLKRELGIDFHDEINVPRDDLDVHGRCDGICTIDGQAVIVEFKSINLEKVDKAKEEHIGQLTWYMHMFKKLKTDLKEDFGFKDVDFVSESEIVGMESLSGRHLEDLNYVEKWLLFSQGEVRGEIIYESKQNQSTFHFPLDYDIDRAKKVRLWFEQLKWHIDNKEIPNVKYNPNYFPCSWKTGACPYWGTCWK